jgi:glyoxylase-like metal-dependent hydrolase (beta-lactamase superfamily II)
MIITKEGPILKNIYMIDCQQYGLFRMTSSFLYWDGDVCVVFDVGTSDNVMNLMLKLKKYQIPLTKVRAVITSHYHFDHGGGVLNLWRRISPKNLQFKIMVTQETHDFLQNAQEHTHAAETTFGDFVGTMNPVPEEAYEIVHQDINLPFQLQNEYSIKLISTPGHSKDHSSPTVYLKEKPVFCFTGEAAGTLFHSTQLVCLPTSMPNFQFELYMQNLEKIISMDIETIGFCHFGAIQGRQDISTFLMEHKRYMYAFRDKILKLYKENPTTRYVIENTSEFWKDRFDVVPDPKAKIFQNLQLALTYGLMISLGLRQSKYEKVK